MANGFTKILTIVRNVLFMVRDELSKMNIKSYSISVVIASFIWLVMTMSDNYTERVEFPVTYSNFPKGLVLVNTPVSDISVDVKSQGFELISVALSEKKSVNIDLNEIKFRKTKYGRFVASVSTKSFRYSVVNQLKVDDVGKDFMPDSVFFVFDSIISRELPVKFNSSFSYDDGYIAYGDPIIEPNTVVVTGPALDVKKMDFVLTKHIELKEVRSNFAKEVGLISSSEISLGIAKVKVKQNVSKYSEFKINRRIELKTNIPNLHVKLFPKSVDVLFSMPLPDYKRLSDTAFYLTVKIDSLDILQQKKLLIDLSRLPKNADNIRLSKESVEYIILD